MLIEDVKKLSPFDRLAYFIRERESIRLKKETREQKPWTDDMILQSYRFCNCRRMDDKVSKWLLENWYEPYFDHPNMLAAVALARFFNKPDTLGLIEGYIFYNQPQPPQWVPIKMILREGKSNGMTIFNGAYMVSGGPGCDKIESVVDYYVKPLVDEPPRLNPKSMEKTWGNIVTRYGFGSFMAGQVVADLRWAMKGTWNDRDIWAPVGPGSSRGMNRLHGRDPHKLICQEQFGEELLDLIVDLLGILPVKITDRLEAHDYQNCLCEFDKFSRTILSEGKPKQKYKGV